MANLRRWSTSASGNATVTGGVNTINFAEGQTPGSVNNSAREMMAQVRGIYNPSDWGWVENSATASVASQTSFKLAGNQTSDWATGRRWRLKSGSTTRYGSVVSSSYTSETTVTVTVDSGSLSASHSLAALSVIDASSNQLPLMAQSFLRNRIINGDMRIDQRNAGASAATSSANTYFVDRWIVRSDTAAGTAGRSTTSPIGFINSLVFTAGTGASPSVAQVNTISQRIEGVNIADLNWGFSTAVSVTVSFWVRSSLTGTFAFRIGNGSRSYVATYTINSANTFEYKTITIAGDTTGTWATDTSVGMYLNWDLGSGSNNNTASPGTWVAADAFRTSGCVTLVATTGATFSLTGVQLEAGSVATPFERRQYGQELALCQRYLPAIITQASTSGDIANGVTTSTSSGAITVPFPVTPRTSPTGVTIQNVGSFSVTTVPAGSTVCTSITFTNAGPNGARLQVTGTGTPYTSNQPYILFGNGSATVGRILFDGAEL